MEFTAREIQILDQLSVGRTYKEVAYDLGITYGTIRSYMERMRQRTGLRSTEHAVAVRVECRTILRMLAERDVTGDRSS